MPAHGEERLSSSREQGCHQEPKRPASCPGTSPPPGLLCKPPPCGTLCLCRSELTNAPRLQRAGGWGRRKGGVTAAVRTAAAVSGAGQTDEALST